MGEERCCLLPVRASNCSIRCSIICRYAYAPVSRWCTVGKYLMGGKEYAVPATIQQDEWLCVLLCCYYAISICNPPYSLHCLLPAQPLAPYPQHEQPARPGLAGNPGLKSCVRLDNGVEHSLIYLYTTPHRLQSFMVKARAQLRYHEQGS